MRVQDVHRGASNPGSSDDELVSVFGDGCGINELGGTPSVDGA